MLKPERHSDKPNALCITYGTFANFFWGSEHRAQLQEWVHLHPEVLGPEQLLENPQLMETVDYIFGSWGMPLLDADTLANMPRLKGVFYAGGTVRGFVTDAFWNSGIKLTSSAALNSIPVAEYCVATILFSLKSGFRHILRIRETKRWHSQNKIRMAGAYQSTVGLISLGAIGRKTLELLQPYDLNFMVYSTHLSEEMARSSRVEKASLEEIFSSCDVISLHTALLPETTGMITGDHFRLMKPGATFINTARGAIVNQPEMVKVLRERPDIFAVLDVTDPEPPEEGSPLFELPNVTMTPHISGSMQHECRRLGQNAIDEFLRFLGSKPLLGEVKVEDMTWMA